MLRPLHYPTMSNALISAHILNMTTPTASNAMQTSLLSILYRIINRPFRILRLFIELQLLVPYIIVIYISLIILRLFYKRLY